MIIKVERHGGLLPIQNCIEMDTKDLPSKFITALKKIMTDQSLSNLLIKAIPKGAADYYSYKISVRDGVNRKVIECNEYNIPEDLKSLVRYVERNSKKKK